MDILRSREIYRDARILLIVVESVNLQHTRSDFCCHIQGSITPLTVIVHTPDGIYARDMEAKPVALESLRAFIPVPNTPNR